MRLRKLEIKDAPLMLEWMHDDSVVKYLRENFLKKELSDCENFIEKAQIEDNNIHYAIVDDNDEYMGTVSLKSINRNNKSGEFAIAVRKYAMGKGFAWFGMKHIIQWAFDKYGLEVVYWCVSEENNRAIGFYNKHGFIEVSDIPKVVLKKYSEEKNLKWYYVNKKNWDVSL